MENQLKILNIDILYNEIKEIIEQAKRQIVTQANSTLTHTYWNIGKRVRENIVEGKRAEYGEEVVSKVSEKLIIEYGRGFGKRNVLRMMKFYDLFSDFKKVTTLSSQFSWSHFVELIKIEDELK